MAVASLVLGILSIIGSICVWYIAIILGIIGLVLGIKDQSGSGIRKAGIVTNIIGISFSAVWLIFFILIFGTSFAFF